MANVRRFLRRHRWWLIFVLAMTAIILGTLGYGSAIRGLPFGDRLYDTINLFHLGGTSSLTPPLPTTLEIARWMAPVTLGLAGLWAANSLLTEQFTHLRVRWWCRKHVIVCGLGTFGRAIAEGFDARGDQVVVVDRDPAGYDAAWCRSAGIPLVHGDATDWRVLETAGLSRARRVIAVCGTDGVNAEVALHVRNRRRGTSRPIDCYVHLDDSDLCALLEEHSRTLDRLAIRVHFLNVNRAGPMAILQSYSELFEPRAAVVAGGVNKVGTRVLLHQYSDQLASGPGPPHVIVVGSEPLALALVTGAARSWWFDRRVSQPPEGDGATAARLPVVTLVAKDAEERRQQLLARYPRLDDACRLEAVQVDADDPAVSMPPLLLDGAAITRGVAFICLADESRCLAAAIRLRRAVPEPLPIVACILGRSGSVSGIDVVGEQLRSRSISTFPLLRRVCDPEFVLNDLTETIARTLHSNYLDDRRSDGTYDPVGKESHRDWDELPETYRESNRAQAQVATARLAKVGYEIRPTDDWEVPLPGFNEEEIETMAIAEHERWCNERIGDGWTYGKERDNANKRHPDIKPWEQLDEPTKEKDREVVRELPTVLAREGLTITKS
jgi:voltage-gated potassium channel Kch